MVGRGDDWMYPERRKGAEMGKRGGGGEVGSLRMDMVEVELVVRVRKVLHKDGGGLRARWLDVDTGFEWDVYLLFVV